MGRRRKSPELARTQNFPLRLNDGEAALLQRVADEHSLDMAGALRMLLRAEARRLGLGRTSVQGEPS